MNYFINKSIVYIFLLSCPLPTFSEFKKHTNELFNLSLEELLDVKVVTASKKSELQFEALYSNTVITYQEIIESGVTSIPEIFRLVPGMIVRQQTADNYDVHIRGLDNLPSQTFLPLAANSLTLVMIDNRIVYNYFAGGTFWETLNIELHDIERVEIIRGGASALYGPNAASGVIHFITKQAQKVEKHYVNVNIEGGSHKQKTFRANAGAFYKQWNFHVTAFDHIQDRHQVSYYESLSGEYVTRDNLRSSITQQPLRELDQRYPKPEVASERRALNTSLSYREASSEVSVSIGQQDSFTQKAYIDNLVTPLTSNESRLSFYDVRAKLNGWHWHISRTDGDQKGLGLAQFDYDLTVDDFSVEYQHNFSSWRLVSGIDYRDVMYEGDFIGGSQDIKSLSTHLQADIALSAHSRLVAAVRFDQYDTPSVDELSYTLSYGYKIANNKNLRFNVTRANRIPFILDSHFNLAFNVTPNFRIENLGNLDLDLTSTMMYEVGYRHRLTQSLELDWEIFRIKAEDYITLTADERFSEGVVVRTFEYNNLPLTAEQLGSTLSMKFQMSEKWRFKGFFTWQQTDNKNFTPNVFDLTVTEDKKHQSTPDFYYGVIANYVPFENWHFNFSGYYYDRHQIQTQEFMDEINSKFVFNVKANYWFSQSLSTYIILKNIGDENQREFVFTDEIDSTVHVGFTYRY